MSGNFTGFHTHTHTHTHTVITLKSAWKTKGRLENDRALGENDRAQEKTTGRSLARTLTLSECPHHTQGGGGGFK